MTLVELAKVCGVSKTTVSAALGGTGRVSDDVRRSVRAAARRTGWRPDPHLSQLMGYLRKSRRAATTCNLAWLNTSLEERRWHDLPWFAGYLKGALRRAQELGYSLDEHWTRGEGVSAASLGRQLLARGIAGVLLPLPEEQPVLRGLLKQALAWVVIDEAEMDLPFPRVQADRHGNLRLLLDEAWQLGYRQPALVLNPYVDQISQYGYSSAYLGWCRLHDVEPLLADLIKGNEEKVIARTLDDYAPDLLVCSDSRVIGWCEAAGRRVPKDLGVAHLNLAADVSAWAGIYQEHESIGAAAVDQLVSLLTLREFPGSKRTLLVPGRWEPAKTVRRQSRSRTRKGLVP